MQESAVLNVFPDHTFPLKFSGPPPPSEAVTLQCSVGGSVTTPIGLWLSGTTCAHARSEPVADGIVLPVIVLL